MLTIPIEERILDWEPGGHDPRSLNYPIRELIGSVDRKPRAWNQTNLKIDQRREGACVGFAWMNELLGSPKRVTVGDRSTAAAENAALEFYRQAQRIDEYPGEAYSGTSVLAGAKVLQERGLIGGFRWSFSIDDFIDTLCADEEDGGGPLVCGLPWLASMGETLPNGLLEVNGRVAGGHAIKADAYHPKMRFAGQGWKYYEVVRLAQSWGPIFGKSGNCFIKVEDLEGLLKMQGEACVPQGRKFARI